MTDRFVPARPTDGPTHGPIHGPIHGPTMPRRSVMAAGLALTATVAAPAWAASDEPGPRTLERAQAFLRSLEPEREGEARFAFDDPVRRRWNFMGPAPKPGLRLESMTPAQKEAAFALVATVLGPEGLEKARTIMHLQDVLRAMGDGPRSRNAERFSVALFGTPSETGLWGWRLEGHHLSLSVTLEGDRVVSVTPSSFSSNPNTVPIGPTAGLTTLVEEELLARRLLRDLAPDLRARAVIRERAFGNILAVAGREDRFHEREGVALASLHPAQVDLLLRLADVYAADHLVPSLAAEQQARVREGDTAGIHLAWAGSDRPGEMCYYRLHGDTFVIEFASLRNQPLHLHTIRHDTRRNLGDHAAA